jgi:hypothetical protein
MTIMLGLTFSAPATAGGNLVVNGGFETGNFDGWTLAGNLSDLFVGSSPNPPHSGSFAAQIGEVGTPGTMSQDLATTQGTKNTLSFWLIGTAAAGPPNLFQVAFGGTTLLNLANYQAPTTYKEYVFNNLLASSASTLLQFTFQQNPSFIALDDISVTTSSSVIPEPSSLTLAAFAILPGIGFWSRSRRRATVV